MENIEEKISKIVQEAEEKNSKPVENEEPKIEVIVSEKETPTQEQKQETRYEETLSLAKTNNLEMTSQDSEVKENLKSKNIDVLNSSIELEKLKVQQKQLEVKLQSDKIETERSADQMNRLRTEFGKKLDKQEYVYKSLQPILETVFVKKPMNTCIMWLIAIIFSTIIPVYPIRLIVCGTVGNLIAGTTSDNRKMLTKGILWSFIVLLCIAGATLIGFGLYKFITWVI